MMGEHIDQKQNLMVSEKTNHKQRGDVMAGENTDHKQNTDRNQDARLKHRA